MPQQDDTGPRAELLAERARIEREIAEYTSGNQTPYPDSPHDTTDLDVGDTVDAADDLEQEERDAGIVVVLRERLAEIDAALARMDANNQSGR